MTAARPRPRDRFRLRPAAPADFAEIYAVWLLNQRRSFGGDLSELQIPNEAEFASSFSMTTPFGVWVLADREGSVAGWGAVQLCKHNPMTRHRAGEIVLHVRDPDGKQNGAVFLLRGLLAHCTAAQMSFVIGYSSPTNGRVGELLSTCGFFALGAAGRHPTQLWTYTVPDDDGEPPAENSTADR